MSNYRQISKQIAKGRFEEESLSSFLRNLKKDVAHLSLHNLLSAYYNNLLYLAENNLDEGLEDYSSQADGLIEEAFLDERASDLPKRVEKLRRELLSFSLKFDAVTTMYQVYAHAFARKYSIHELSLPKDLDEEAKKILEFIFGSEESFLVNLNIQDVCKALPIRFTKAKFLEILMEALDSYQGSDRLAFINFLYRIKDSFFVDVIGEEDKKAFSFFRELEVFSGVDIAGFSKEEARELYEKLTKLIDDGMDAFEDCRRLLEIVNALVGYLSFMEEAEGFDKTKELSFLRELLSWKIRLCDFSDEDEARLDELFSEFVPNFEELQEKVFRAEPLIEQLLETDGLSSREELIGLQNAIYIMEYPYFKEEDRENFGKTVDKEYLNKVKTELEEKFLTLFQNNKLPVRRSIMAYILKELPVFLKNRTEVMDYVRTALHTCDREEELRAALFDIYDMRSNDDY